MRTDLLHDLFQLIKSMSSAEKQQFSKKFLSSKDRKSGMYATIYQTIERAPEFNEKLLRKKLSALPGATQLPVMMHYLFNLIVEDLAANSELQSIKLRQLLNEAEVLMKRESYGAAFKRLVKAQKWAVDIENYSMAIEISEHRMRYFNASKKNNVFIPHDPRAFQQELGTYIFKQTSSLDLEVKRRIFGKDRNDISKHKLQQFYRKAYEEQLKLLNAEHFNQLSLKAKCTLFEYLSHLAFHLHDFSSSSLYNRRALDIMKDNNKVFEMEETSYLYTLYAFGISSIDSKNYIEVEKTMEEISSVKSSINWIKHIKFEFYWNLKLNLLELRDNYQGAELLLSEFLAKYNPLRPVLRSTFKLYLDYQLSLYYFHVKDFNRLSGSTNNILNEQSWKKQLQYEPWVRFLDLVAHYELGHRDLLISKLRTAKYHLAEDRKIFMAEVEFLDLFQALISTPDSEHKTLLKETGDKLKLIFEDEKERENLEHCDILHWIEYRINRKSRLKEK